MRLGILNLGLRFFVRPVLRFSNAPRRAQRIFDFIGPRVFAGPAFICHLTEILGDRVCHWISVGKVHPRRVVLYFHGGAYFVGSGTAYRGLAARLSTLTGLRVCVPDYRLLQDAPFPAAFEDAVDAWDALIAKGYRPKDIILGGDSAGGGLMFALLAHLLGCNQSPRAAFAMSPWVDLTLSGPSLRTKTEVLLPVARMGEVVDRYLCGADRSDPRASPLFAEFADAPPVLIQVGRCEALLDDAKRMAAVLGHGTTLDVWDRVPHVWQFFDGYIPQAHAALTQFAAFVQTSFESDNR